MPIQPESRHTSTPVVGAVRPNNDTFVSFTATGAVLTEGDQVTSWASLVTPATKEVWLVINVGFDQALSAVNRYKAGDPRHQCLRVYPAASLPGPFVAGYH
jgi:phosphohistidine swiveling domain-containing protein